MGTISDLIPLLQSVCLSVYELLRTLKSNELITLGNLAVDRKRELFILRKRKGRIESTISGSLRQRVVAGHEPSSEWRSKIQSSQAKKYRSASSNERRVSLTLR